jgi:hypothetical protein
MENKNEQIPEEIFNWIGNLNFQDLSESQKTQVLHWFSEEEYQAVRAGLSGIQEIDLSGDTFSNKKIKKELLDAFDQKHEKKPRLIIIPQITFWRAASVILFMACAALLYSVTRQSKQVIIQPVASADTVYIIRDTPATPAADSVPTVEYSHHEKNSIQYNSGYTVPSNPKRIKSGTTRDIYIPGLDELNNKANRQKRNSVKDDSLVKEYSVRTM